MARQLTASELQALVRLLGDDDERTVKVARQRLMEAGEAAVRWLVAAANEADPMVRGRARLLLDDLRFQGLKDRLTLLVRRGSDEFDLEEGLFVVARSRYPDLDEAPYRERLRAMSDELVRRKVPRMSAPEAAAAINRYLFHELGLRSNEAHYYDPDNVCIHQVLDRKAGVGLSLAALYLVVGRRAGFQAHAVSLPGRIVVSVPTSPPFWVDPAESGRVLSRHDLVAIAREAGHQFEESMLDPLPDRELVERMLAHLMRVYALTSQRVAAERAEELLKVLSRGAGDKPGAAASSVSRGDSGA
ncbi:transglutaminase-like domain-containing protein [Carboxydochorda subterranea]|uniref:Transglutaminase-like domain-containing protein n=1 Tax=Carboxydichorda subterranea TaxID=3109565 RepID=A0ABZ1BZ64_9FIRM|nr:transglutaminase-like domain-containing protein [Limnochorda sp. L945t]WRP17362.1 transglutaminase-like domain-containing protein [Limnochorda sp. L945t]